MTDQTKELYSMLREVTKQLIEDHGEVIKLDGRGAFVPLGGQCKTCDLAMRSLGLLKRVAKKEGMK